MLLYRAMNYEVLTLHKKSLHAHALWIDVLNPCEHWVIKVIEYQPLCRLFPCSKASLAEFVEYWKERWSAMDWTLYFCLLSVLYVIRLSESDCFFFCYLSTR